MWKKRFAMFALVIPSLFGDPLQDLATELAQKLKGPGAKVAVLPFPNQDGKSGSGATLVQERLTTYLVNGGKVQVVERKLLSQVLKELALDGSGLVDDEQAKKIGKLLSVSGLVMGTLSVLANKQVEINARVVEVETGRILVAAQARVTPDWDPAVVVANPNYLGKPRVQLAMLLDTSSSMDGLIGQAKNQLWKIVNELARGERDGQSPEITVALYEYGNTRIPAEALWVRRVNGLTNDLDHVSANLFSLKTSGGSEYCGAAIDRAAAELSWDNHTDVYKAIFIAGNEPFTQGGVLFSDAIAKAVGKGIFVNTIFCGRRQEGIATQWQKGAEMGNGEYVNIDQAQQVVAAAAPQDVQIAELNTRLNGYYIPYQKETAREAKRNQEIQDTEASRAPASGAAQERSLFKARAQYNEAVASWDIVSALETGKIKVEDLKKEDLPENLRGLKTPELKKHFEKLLAEKLEVRQKINQLSEARRQYLASAATPGQTNTLDQAMINAIRGQAKTKNMTFKN